MSYVSTPPTSGRFVHLTESALVKRGSGSLASVIVGTGASGASVTLYDGTSSSGAVISTLSATGTVSLWYGLEFTTGLYLTVSGAVDVTVTYS